MTIPFNHNCPIPGVAGAEIYAALTVLSMRAGEASVTITKRKAESGGYIYVISNLNKG